MSNIDFKTILVVVSVITFIAILVALIMMLQKIANQQSDNNIGKLVNLMKKNDCPSCSTEDPILEYDLNVLKNPLYPPQRTPNKKLPENLFRRYGTLKLRELSGTDFEYLILIGRKIHLTSKFEYYAIPPKQSKLKFVVKNKNGIELYHNDTVHVDIIGKDYEVFLDEVEVDALYKFSN